MGLLFVSFLLRWSRAWYPENNVRRPWVCGCESRSALEARGPELCPLQNESLTDLSASALSRPPPQANRNRMLLLCLSQYAVSALTVWFINMLESQCNRHWQQLQQHGGSWVQSLSPITVHLTLQEARDRRHHRVSSEVKCKWESSQNSHPLF